MVRARIYLGAETKKGSKAETAVTIRSATPFDEDNHLKRELRGVLTDGRSGCSKSKVSNYGISACGLAYATGLVNSGEDTKVIAVCGVKSDGCQEICDGLAKTVSAIIDSTS